MINVSRVIHSPRMQQPFKVYRQSGYWSEGSFIESEAVIDFTGIVTVADPDDLEQLPEGDRVKGMMCFYSTEELFATRNEDDDKGTSDQIEWNGKRYRLAKVLPFSGYGYYKAFGARMAGD